MTNPTISTTPLGERAFRERRVRNHPDRLTFGHVLRSEWIKFRSVRSTVWSYAIVVMASMGLGFLLALSLPVYLEMGNGGTLSHFIVQASTFGVFFGQLAVAVLGVLFISGEYSTGMIRSTLTAVPRRLPVLVAKALVLFFSSLIVGLISALSACAVAAPVLASRGVRANLADMDVLLPLCASAFYLAVVSVFALGLGAIVRNTAGGIAAALGIILVLPLMFSIAPVQWMHDAIPYLLMNAGMSTFSSVGTASALDTWQQFLVIITWAAATLLIGAVLLKRRDA